MACKAETAFGRSAGDPALMRPTTAARRKGRKMSQYTNNSDRGGMEIRETKKGFMVSTWSRVSGDTTDRKELYAFDDEFRPGQDMSEMWADGATYATALVHTRQPVKVLRRGYTVQ